VQPLLDSDRRISNRLPQLSLLTQNDRQASLCQKVEQGIRQTCVKSLGNAKFDFLSIFNSLV
jgi:hypothetical protein